MIRIAVAACCLGLMLGANAAEDSETRLRELKQEIDAGQHRVRRASDERSAVERVLQATETELATLRGRQARVAAELAAAQRRLEQLAARRDGVERIRQGQQRRLSEDVALAYRLGRSEPLKVLLNQENPFIADRMMQYYGHFVAARARQLADYRATLDELTELAEAEATALAELQESRARLERDRVRAEAVAQERKTLMAKLSAQLSDEQSRLDKLHDEARRLQSLLDELARRREASSGGAFADQASRLPWPVAGRLINRYGTNRAGSLRWNGWMLAVAEGTPVHAVHGGTVVFSDYLRGYGELVILDHGGGYLTLYAHNQVRLKAAGASLQGGEVIARAGSSGGLLDSALYFEIRRGSEPLDPARWLRKEP